MVNGEVKMMIETSKTSDNYAFVNWRKINEQLNLYFNPGDENLKNDQKEQTDFDEPNTQRGLTESTNDNQEY